MQTYIGVDISKNDFLACLNELDKPIKFANNNLGLTKFFSYLESNKYLKEETIIGLESTGSYGLPLAITGTRNNYTVKIINPIVTKAYLGSSIRKVKTDKADAKVIRDCLVSGAGAEFRETPEETVFKNLIRQRYFLVKLKTELTLKQQDITLKEEYLKLPISSINMELKEIIEKKIIFLEQELEACLPAQQALLRSIPGVGKITAMTFATEIGDISKFSSAKKLVGFVGIDSKIRQSGTSLNIKGHISKRGNRIIRKTLYVAALTAIQRPSLFRDFYQKKLSEGKAKNVCIVAVMRKMIHVIYAVLKRQSPFVSKEA
jgi:transposase